MSTESDSAKKEAGGRAEEIRQVTRSKIKNTPKGAENSTENVTQAAARGTISTLILRLISFACTQLTIRSLKPSTLGASIQLELLLTTVLFISREGFRLALTQNVIAETWTVGLIHISAMGASLLNISIKFIYRLFLLIGGLAHNSRGIYFFGNDPAIALALFNYP